MALVFAYTDLALVEPSLPVDASGNKPQLISLVYLPTETLYTNFHVQGVDPRNPETYVPVSVEIIDSNDILVYQNTLTSPAPSWWWVDSIVVGTSSGNE